MQRGQLAVAIVGSAFLVAGDTPEVLAQVATLAPLRASGQSVTPAFEGWYMNPDGTYSISFGYYNRNGTETVEVPIGPSNYMAPGDSNQGQPTHFVPRRHFGVFAVKVPANFGNKTVVWNLTVAGQTYAIPGSLKRGWEIDALQGEAGSGNTPPKLRFAVAGGATGAGPGGITGPSLNAKVGTPAALDVWVSDEGTAASGTTPTGRGGALPTLTWFKHQGPGVVTFADATPTVDRASGKATTTATFDKPGTYIVRVRANDSPMASAGHAQCCWSNGFVKVTVTP
jgi:hypothetical protein